MSKIGKNTPLLAAFIVAAILLCTTYLALVRDQQQFAAISMFLFAATIPRILDFISRHDRREFAPVSLEYVNVDDTAFLSIFASDERGRTDWNSDAPVIDAKAESPDSDWRPSRFIGSDNPLALAQLRLSLERELRRISIEHKQVPSTSLTRTLRNLVQKEVLPKDLDYLLRDVVSVCNAAVHGADIDDATAESVVDNGERILLFLQRTRIDNPVSGLET